MNNLFFKIIRRIHHEALSLYLGVEFFFYSKILGVSHKWFNLSYGKMYLPLSPKVSGNERRFQSREPFTFKILKENLNPGDSVLEIGACMGEFTIYISNLIGQTGTCYSVEPFPKYVEIFKKNIEANDITNVIHIERAIGNSEGFIEFSLQDESSYDGIHTLWNFKPRKSLTSERKDKLNLKRIPILKVSDLINTEKIIDFLFMDIEGCETLVFDDLFQNVNPSQFPTIYFESHQGLYGQKTLDNSLQRFIDNGFKVEQVSYQHFLIRKKEY